MEFAASWISDFIQFCTERGVTCAEATQDAADMWTQHVFESTRGLLLNEVKPDRMGNNKAHGKYHEILLRYNGSAPQFRKKCLDAASEQYRELRLA